jgi:hypothetical protein
MLRGQLLHFTLPVGLFALKDKVDRLMLRPYDAYEHGAIRGKSVGFERNRAGLRTRVRHFQDVVIPPGLRLELFARVNRGIVLAVGNIAVEEGITGAFIFETSGDRDVTIPLVDCHGAGLNDGLAGKITLGGHERPDAVQSGVLVRECGGCKQESQDRADSRSG